MRLPFGTELTGLGAWPAYLLQTQHWRPAAAALRSDSYLGGLKAAIPSEFKRPLPLPPPLGPPRPHHQRNLDKPLLILPWMPDEATTNKTINYIIDLPWYTKV